MKCGCCGGSGIVHIPMGGIYRSFGCPQCTGDRGAGVERKHQYIKDNSTPPMNDKLNDVLFRITGTLFVIAVAALILLFWLKF